MAHPFDTRSLSHDSQQALRQYLYTPMEEAIQILQQRQKLNHLKPLDFMVPEPLQPNYQWGSPQSSKTAVMFRQIATPNHEMRRAVKLCEKYQLNLLILSFQEDKFISCNASKHALGRMGFFDGLGRAGGKKLCYSTILNFNQFNGRALRECQTFRGQPLIKFHHDLLLSEFQQLRSENLFECSHWFIQQRREVGNLYRAFLKLFLKHAILLETFVLSASELAFTLKKVLPAFQEIDANFGMKPLIVNADTESLDDDVWLQDVNSDRPPPEDDDYWLHYPSHLHALAPYDRRAKARLALLREA